MVPQFLSLNQRRPLSRIQNFPNPFNPDTNILFTLPNSGNVNIRIYDVFGREITTLFSGNKASD